MIKQGQGQCTTQAPVSRWNGMKKIGSQQKTSILGKGS